MKTNSKQKNALLVMLLSLLIPNVMAQEPKTPTLEDLIPGGAAGGHALQGRIPHERRRPLLFCGISAGTV